MRARCISGSESNFLGMRGEDGVVKQGGKWVGLEAGQTGTHQIHGKPQKGAWTASRGVRDGCGLHGPGRAHSMDCEKWMAGGKVGGRETSWQGEPQFSFAPCSISTHSMALISSRQIRPASRGLLEGEIS